MLPILPPPPSPAQPRGEGRGSILFPSVLPFPSSPPAASSLSLRFTSRCTPRHRSERAGQVVGAAVARLARQQATRNALEGSLFSCSRENARVPNAPLVPPSADLALHSVNMCPPAPLSPIADPLALQACSIPALACRWLPSAAALRRRRVSRRTACLSLSLRHPSVRVASSYSSDAYASQRHPPH
jgi:hypothetical protein